MKKRILLVGTADTKGKEFAYLRSAIAEFRRCSGAYMPQRSAGVCTGASHNFVVLSSSKDKVIEAPAISSDVT